MSKIDSFFDGVKNIADKLRNRIKKDYSERMKQYEVEKEIKDKIVTNVKEGYNRK